MNITRHVIYEIYLITVLEVTSLYLASSFLSSVSVSVYSNSHLLSHTLMFTADIPNFFLILPADYLIRYRTFFLSDPLLWAWSTGTAVLHWAYFLFLWCQNMVSCQEPFGTDQFQLMFKGLFTGVCSCEIIPPGMTTFLVFIGWITDLTSSVKCIWHKHSLFFSNTLGLLFETTCS
jgi:hypothetical protein